MPATKAVGLGRFLVLFGSILLISLTSTISAQRFPDAGGLLRQRAHALQQHRSFEYTEDEVTEEFSMVNSVQGLSGGKLRVESKNSMMTMLMVSDGQHTWMYQSLTQTYTKSAATSQDAKDSVRDALNLDNDEDEAVLEKNARVLRSETVELGGKIHDCWVVESRLPRKGREESVHTYWIDQALAIDLKMTVSDPIIKVTKRSLKFDGEVLDSVFAFTPPPGAKETAQLFPGVGSSTAAGGDSETKPPSAAQPQTYVSQMHPVERVRAEYPEAARSAHVTGTVRLLLTIDGGGSVVDTETLSGPAVLRPAAVAAVKKYRFLPVLRDGKPVSAYTDTLVVFTDPAAPPGTPIKMTHDQAEEMAAGQRLYELQRKFQRTPDEVLGDSEQDLQAADIRVYALGKAANAALNAGALEKARAYATELLQKSKDVNDWNYGNAIHDGNMILGLIALRENNVEQAKRYLIESGKTPGSPQLDSFGPDLHLARELAEKGERDTVLEYFGLCRVFWKMGGQRLDALAERVRSGKSF